MVELWELFAREQIRDTVARYNQAGDRGRWDDMVGCFTPDGEVRIVGGDTHRGRGSLRAFFSGVPGSVQPGLTQLRHCLTDLVIDIESEASARAASNFSVITDIGLDHWGRYRDRLVPVDGRWLLAQRSVKTDGSVPGSFFELSR